MTTTTGAVLRLGLSDVAQLAHVQRPVVSMWRARSAGSDRPFPAPVDTARGQEWFDGASVVDWLAACGRGNNPSARDDLAAYASLDGGSPQGDQTVFHGITALLCLSVITGRALGPMGRDDLIDLADEVDPDDNLLFGEIDSLTGRLEPLAHYTDLLVCSIQRAGGLRAIDGRSVSGVRSEPHHHCARKARTAADRDIGARGGGSA